MYFPYLTLLRLPSVWDHPQQLPNQNHRNESDTKHYWYIWGEWDVEDTMATGLTVQGF